MTSSRRDAHICRALIAAAVIPAAYFAVQPSWWCAPCAYVVLFLGWCERRLTADHRRHAAQHVGGGANAEDCPACSGNPVPYPFICPGPTPETKD